MSELTIIMSFALASAGALVIGYAIFRAWQQGQQAGADAANVSRDKDRADENEAIIERQTEIAKAGASPVSTADDLANGKF